VTVTDDDHDAGQRPANPVPSDYDQNPDRIRLARSVLRRRAGDIAFLDGTLSDPDREIVATATARVITMEPTAR
jgi:hypothetical protein